MPTAAEYQVWASRLGALADDLEALSAPLVRAADPEAIIGGLLAVTVDLAVRASQANSLDAAALVVQLADECRNRQVICQDYADRYAHYESRLETHRERMRDYLTQVDAGQVMGERPLPPAAPVKLHDWVDR